MRSTSLLVLALLAVGGCCKTCPPPRTVLVPGEVREKACIDQPRPELNDDAKAVLRNIRGDEECGPVCRVSLRRLHRWAVQADIQHGCPAVEPGSEDS